MKIGTDGVLLGAWAEIPERSKNILDIGTGSGVLSLQAAQRTSGSAQILGVDIDRSAVKTATENFKNSSWSSCLEAKEWDITTEANTLGTENFDCILCNPPFFEGGALFGRGGLPRFALVGAAHVFKRATASHCSHIASTNT